MDKLLTRREAAKALGISIYTLDAARVNGQIAFIQYVENGSVFFSEAGIQEYIARNTHRVRPKEAGPTYRKIRGSGK